MKNRASIVTPLRVGRRGLQLSIIAVATLVLGLCNAHAETYSRVLDLPVQTSPDSTYSIPSSNSSGVNYRIPFNYFGTAASDTAFGSSWNAVTTIPPTKNAIYDYAHLFDTDDDGKVNVLDLAAGLVQTNSSGVVSLAVAGTDYLSPAAIGSTVQAFDADLTLWAAITPGSGWAALLAATKPTTLAGYGITDAQPLDSDLTTLAATSGTNTIYYRSGVGTWPAVTIGNGLSFSAPTLSLGATAITGQTEDTSPDRANDFVLTYDVSASALKKAKLANFSGDVSAASAFGTDNRLIRSDGTSKGIQASGITIDDSDNMSGIASISATDTDAETFKILDAVDQSHGLSFIVASNLIADKAFTYNGAFNFGMTVTADTGVTFPISGTLLSSNFPMNGVGLANSSYYRQTGIISPTLSGDVNDWSPTGLATASIIRIDPGASNRNITGLDAQPDGTIIELQNISSTANRTITLKDSSASSSSANRFLFKNDLVISGSKAALIWYDGTTAQWRPYGRALINSGVASGTYGTATQTSTFTVGGDGIITSATNTPISITAIPTLTSNGFVKTSGGVGTLSVDTGTYVDTTSAQGLTNKTINDATNSIGDANTYVHDLTAVPNQTGGWTEYYVTGSDYSTAVTATGTDITGLVTGTLSASTKYEFEVNLEVTHDTDTAGVKFAIHGAGTGSAATVYSNFNVNGGAVATGASVSVNAVDTATVAVLNYASAHGVIRGGGCFYSTSTGTPTMSLQIFNTTAGNAVVKTGSVLRIKKAHL